MAWIWRFENESGEALRSPKSESFSSKGDAETWLGESWRELLKQGVYQVTLLDDGRVEYGPMSLQGAT